MACALQGGSRATALHISVSAVVSRMPSLNRCGGFAALTSVMIGTVTGFLCQGRKTTIWTPRLPANGLQN